MLRYNEYLLELEFKKWETLSEITNEGFDSLMDRINVFLDKEYTIDSTKFEEVATNLLKRFKSKLKILTIIVSLLVGSYMTINKVENLMNKAGVENNIKQEVLEKVSKKGETSKKISNLKKAKNEVGKFLKALAQRESSSNPKSINSLGYIGKYQMGQMALQDLELDDTINAHKFKKNPNIFPEIEQDRAMVKLLKLNKNYLGDYIDRFVGKEIGGVNITKSGLLAGSHLVGAGSVKKFLDSNGTFIPKDDNGVPVTEYIKKFGGYNISL